MVLSVDRILGKETTTAPDFVCYLLNVLLEEVVPVQISFKMLTNNYSHKHKRSQFYYAKKECKQVSKSSKEKQVLEKPCYILCKNKWNGKKG